MSEITFPRSCLAAKQRSVSSVLSLSRTPVTQVWSSALTVAIKYDTRSQKSSQQTIQSSSCYSKYSQIRRLDKARCRSPTLIVGHIKHLKRHKTCIVLYRHPTDTRVWPNLGWHMAHNQRIIWTKRWLNLIVWPLTQSARTGQACSALAITSYQIRNKTSLDKMHSTNGCNKIDQPHRSGQTHQS